MNNYALSQLLKKVNAKTDVLLSQFSTMKIGGAAKYFCLINSINDLRDIQKASHEHNIPMHVIGGCSNTLFSDNGFNGIILKLGPSFDFINNTSQLSLKVGAATSYAKVTKLAISMGWLHAVGWCGTPGVVGGAIRMNAGTKMGVIQDAIGTIKGVCDGEIKTYSKNEINFSYRSNDLPKNLIICEAELNYPSDQIRPVDELNQKANEYRRKRRATQPSINSLGSFFVNPYPAFAAQLIESCGLKGLRYNSAQISPLHANFIINTGGAKANDVLHLAFMVQQKVFDTCGILLKPEIKLVGDFDEYKLKLNKNTF